MRREIERLIGNSTAGTNVIAEMVRFQTDRNLHKMEYERINAHGNIVEELLESIGLAVPKANRPQLKEAWQDFVGLMQDLGIANMDETNNYNINGYGGAVVKTESIVDAYCDIMEFCTGELLKLGYIPEKALLEMTKEINSRAGEVVDGKFQKDMSVEAVTRWYKANYATCEIREYNV